MNLNHLFNENELKVLEIKFETLLSDIKREMTFLSPGEEIELIAFLFVLDLEFLPLHEKHIVVPYNRKIVQDAIYQLREIWTNLQCWYFQGRVVTSQEWKTIYNPKAGIWNAPPIL